MSMAVTLGQILDPEIAAVSLEIARGLDPDEFRKGELEWLDQNSPVGHMAVTSFFAWELSKRGCIPDEIAEPGYQGAVFGTFIARRHAEAGRTSVAAIAANHRLNLAGKIMSYAHDVEEDVMLEVLGRPTANVIMTVSYPAARTMCTVMLLASLYDVASPVAENFLADQPKVKPPVRRQASGRSS